MASPAPAYASNDGVIDAVRDTLGALVLDATDTVGEIAISVPRGSIVEALRGLRDELGYQQLMEMAGVDWPDRPERFEVVYMLLSLTKNHRVRVHISTDEDIAVPSVTGLWPVAGWLEREIFDMFGVLFEGNTDLRRILTDYGFQGHPFRKDFPLSGHVEMRYSEEAKRVVYEPVQLAQDFRTFDFLSPWEGAEYVLPGDEKAPQAPGAPTPLPAAIRGESVAQAAPGDPKVTEKPSDTGAGKPAEDAMKKSSEGKAVERDAEVSDAKDSAPAETKGAAHQPSDSSAQSKGGA